MRHPRGHGIQGTHREVGQQQNSRGARSQCYFMVSFLSIFAFRFFLSLFLSFSLFSFTHSLCLSLSLCVCVCYRLQSILLQHGVSCCCCFCCFALSDATDFYFFSQLRRSLPYDWSQIRGKGFISVSPLYVALFMLWVVVYCIQSAVCSYPPAAMVVFTCAWYLVARECATLLSPLLFLPCLCGPNHIPTPNVNPRILIVV